LFIWQCPVETVLKMHETRQQKRMLPFRVPALFCALLAFVALAAILCHGEEIAPQTSPAHSVTTPTKPVLRAATNAQGHDISGDRQIGVIDNNLPQPFVILVTDSDGKPLPGVKVSWEVVSEPEGVKQHVRILPLNDAISDSRGLFSAECILGDVPGNYRAVFYAFGEKPSEASFVEFEAIASKPTWGNWLLVGLAGGLALLLYGMKVSAEGLQSFAGARLRSAIGGITRNPVAGVGFGTLGTFLTQSSTATTSMLVSLVNTRLLTVRESLGLIFGAAIGSTITVQLISFNIYEYSLVMIVAGFLLLFSAKRRRTVALGNIIIGFGFVFFGMKVMIQVMEPLRAVPGLRNAMLVLKNHPGWSVILSALFTGLIHSSGATLGLTLSIASHGLLDLKTAIPIIFGAVIGTCATALMVAATGPRDGKRVAWAHLLFKTISVLLFFPFIAYVALAGAYVSHLLQPDASVPRQIANTYTLFAIVIAALFLPLRTQLERLVYLIVPHQEDERDEVKTKYLDLQMLDAPSIAIGSSLREISRMGRFVQEMTRSGAIAIFEKNQSERDFIHARDDKVDKLQTSIARYLINLTQRHLSERELEKVFGLLFIVSDLENIGDIIDKNLVPIADKMIAHNLEFSEEGKKELMEMHHKVSEDLSQVMISLASFDRELAKGVMAHKHILTEYGKHLHLHHLRRLQEGLRESVDTSSVHLDLINYFQRIEFYVYRIASVISGETQALTPGEMEK
jgi:phosphate:Na+ symporter